ncbi:MAG: hypothetical protein P8Q48_24020 [Paracoccaceae bacterium]|nr:hypothetical protein [Paracoccaceae bacterium]
MQPKLRQIIPGNRTPLVMPPSKQLENTEHPGGLSAMDPLSAMQYHSGKLH